MDFSIFRSTQTTRVGEVVSLFMMLKLNTVNTQNLMIQVLKTLTFKVGFWTKVEQVFQRPYRSLRFSKCFRDVGLKNFDFYLWSLEKPNIVCVSMEIKRKKKLVCILKLSFFFVVWKTWLLLAYARFLPISALLPRAL